MSTRKIVLSIILIIILTLTFFSNLIFKNNETPTEVIKFDTGDTAWTLQYTLSKKQYKNYNYRFLGQ